MQSDYGRRITLDLNKLLKDNPTHQFSIIFYAIYRHFIGSFLHGINGLKVIKSEDTNVSPTIELLQNKFCGDSPEDAKNLFSNYLKVVTDMNWKDRLDFYENLDQFMYNNESEIITIENIIAHLNTFIENNSQQLYQ